MRISDWSSDVCSSDLRPPQALEAVADRPQGAQRLRRLHPRPRGDAQGHAHQACALDAGRLQRPEARPPDADPRPARPPAGHEGSTDAGPTSVAGRKARSEEHTSELQSLMRISYAVFCLKKKTPTPS